MKYVSCVNIAIGFREIHVSCHGIQNMHDKQVRYALFKTQRRYSCQITTCTRQITLYLRTFPLNLRGGGENLAEQKVQVKKELLKKHMNITYLFYKCSHWERKGQVAA